MKVINNKVPTVMFHSLANSPDDLFYLAFPSKLFEEYICLLKRKKFVFVTIDQIVKNTYDHSAKNVSFTFDDGFEDNYKILFPILKKHNINCSIFISSDFIAKQKANNPKQNSNSKWMRPFLSEEQILEMQKSGLVDFQGHSKTHTWYPVSGKIVSRHTISNIEKYYWIYWNAFPKDKPYCLKNSNVNEFSKFAVFDNARSLVARKFHPQFSEFNTPKDIIVVEGKYETDNEMKLRLQEEIIGDKQYLEKLLNKNLSFFCWPGGAISKQAYSVFLESGYRACFVSSNSDKAKIANSIFKKNQLVIQRISPTHKWKKHDLGSKFFLHNIRQTQRYGILKLLFRKLVPRILVLTNKTGVFK